MCVYIVGKNSSQCLWVSMHPRSNKSPHSSLPKYQETYRLRNGAPPLV